MLVLNNMLRQVILASQALYFLQKRIVNPHDPPLTKAYTCSTVDLIEAEGYPAETHTVTTEDGYNLTLHRLAKDQGMVLVTLLHWLQDPHVQIHGSQSSIHPWATSPAPTWL